MICDRCNKFYDEPSTNQYFDFEITVVTCSGRVKYNLCSKCKNKFVKWLTNIAEIRNTIISGDEWEAERIIEDDVGQGN